MTLLGLVIAAVAALAVMWTALVLLLVAVRPKSVDLSEARRFVPDVVRLLNGLARDRALGRGVRVRLFLLVAYLASPIDLVPDFIPLLGYADDVIVAAIALRSVVRHAGREALDAHWRGSPNGLLVVLRLAGLDRS